MKSVSDEPRNGSLRRGIARVVTLCVTVGFAVVGIAGAASAHHNTITGAVACKTGGGWSLTWTVVNSETISETITASNRTNVVPVGTQLTSQQTRTFTEVFTTKPAANVSLTLSSKWTNNVTATNTGTVATSSFSDNCAIKQVTPVKHTVDPPSCTTTGKLNILVQPNGSVVKVNGVAVTPPASFSTPGSYAVVYSAATGYQLTTDPSETVVVQDKLDPNTNPQCRPDQPPNVVRYADDSKEGCNVPGYGAGKLTWRNKYEDYYVWNTTSRSWVLVTDTTAEVVDTKFTPYTSAELVAKGCVTVTPPVPPTFECPPGQEYMGDLNHNGVVDLADCQLPPTPPNKLVYGNAKKIDKCGTIADRYGVRASKGVIYTAKGRSVKHEGVWLKTHGAKRIVVKAHAADGYELAGSRRWVLTYKNGDCSQPPIVSPPTGAERVA